MVSKNHLEQQLRAEFDVVCFVDLADVCENHGMVWQLFRRLHKDNYSPRERLVFFTGGIAPQLVFDHIQKAAKRCDISNFFILICSPQPLSDMLELARKRFDMDIAMQYRDVCVNDARSIESLKIYPSDTLCLAPFVNLNINKYHRAWPCCKFDRRDKSVPTTAQGIMQAMNHESIGELRESMLKGQKHPGCDACWKAESTGVNSLRQDFFIEYQDYEDRINNEIMPPISIEISPSNLCNFKCVICNEEGSSTIAAEKLGLEQDASERARLFKLTKYFNQGTTDLADKLDPIIADIRFLHILGGEPMLLRDTKPLLRKMIDLEANKKICIVLNTNGSVYDSELIELLCQFQSVKILLSIDDIGERFEIQRGGRWADIDRNIRSLALLNSSTTTIKLTPTVNIQNVLYLDQLVTYAREIGIGIHWQYVHDPDFLSIDRMTDRAQQLVINRYHNHAISEFRAIAQRVKQSCPVTDNKFIDHMHKLDKIRNQNFGKHHPEIYLAMHT